MGLLTVSPVFSSEVPDLTTDWTPSSISPAQLHVTAAGNVAVHYTGDVTGKVSILTFNPPTKTFDADAHIDMIYKTGTTVAASNILVVGMPVRNGIQKLYGIANRSHGIPASGAKVTANIDGYFIRNSKSIRDQQIIETTTNAVGYWELYLSYGVRALITVAGKNEVYFSAWVVIRPTDEANIMSYVVTYT